MGKNQRVIQLELKTADGKTGRQWVNDPDHERIDWDEEPDGETISALFQVIGEDGKVVERVFLNGDQWRSIDAHGTLNKVRKWYDRGVSLAESVRSAVDLEDPRGRDGEYEEEIDCLKEQIEHLETNDGQEHGQDRQHAPPDARPSNSIRRQDCAAGQAGDQQGEDDQAAGNQSTGCSHPEPREHPHPRVVAASES